MKSLPPLGICLQPFVAASFLICSAPVQAADPYREQTHGPRIGSRILYFFKDLAYGENPNNRYQHLPRNQRPMPPRQPYVAPPPGGQRYNLDQPPAAAAYPQSRPQQMPPPQGGPRPQPQSATGLGREPVPGPSPSPNNDLPYPSPEAPAADERDASQAGIGEQREALPPVTIKQPKSNAAAKPASAPAKPAPNLDSLPPPLPPVKSEAASTPTPNQMASTTSASKKSWQINQTADSTPETTASVPPPTQYPPTTTTAASGGNTTLTGSRTSKDGRVKSPYPPYNELDVSGLPTGSLAMDPTTGKVFRVP